MTDGSEGGDDIRCLGCGFEAPPDSGDWGSEEHLALGAIPRCPDCGSTTTTGLSDV